MPVLALVFFSITAQTQRVVVYDVSAPDAVYEDVARDAAKTLVSRLAKQRLVAVRAETEAMPEPRCRVGPCLAKVALEATAEALITFDVAEAPNERLSIACAALRASNGALLTARRWVVKRPTDAPKAIDRFAADLVAALAKTNP
jgi:hypothetical protein